MAPKRKDPPSEVAEAPRRSSRSSSKPNSSAAPPAPAPTKAKPASKAEPVAAPSEEKADEPVSEEKAEKKAKTGHAMAVGEVVKDVTLKDENDQEVSLASVYNESGIVLFSYPKANTPGCTTQACGYRDIYDDFSATGYKVFGISADPPKSQLSWKSKHTLGYSFFCDPKKELLKVLGATEDKKRCHWVIEKGGKLLEAKIGVKPADDPKNALEFVKAL